MQQMSMMFLWDFNLFLRCCWKLKMLFEATETARTFLFHPAIKFSIAHLLIILKFEHFLKIFLTKITSLYSFYDDALKFFLCSNIFIHFMISHETFSKPLFFVASSYPREENSCKTFYLFLCYSCQFSTRHEI